MPFLIRALGMRRLVRKERADWVVDLIAKQDPGLMVTAWREAMSFDSRRRLGEIRCPTLVVAGSADDAVPLHHARMLHDGIAESELVVIEGGDHALVWARPDDLVRVIDEFLRPR